MASKVIILLRFLKTTTYDYGRLNITRVIKKPRVIETTALGAAYLVGLQVGLYENLDGIAALWHEEKTYHPEMTASKRAQLYQGWQQAVRRVLTT